MPYFCLMGAKSVLALSKLVLSGQLLQVVSYSVDECVPFWLKSLSTSIATASTIEGSIGTSTMPCLTDHEGPVVAIIGGPEGL